MMLAVVAAVIAAVVAAEYVAVITATTTQSTTYQEEKYHAQLVFEGVELKGSENDQEQGRWNQVIKIVPRVGSEPVAE